MVVSALTIETESSDPRGVRYSDFTKDLAYQLWAFVAGRNSKTVVNLLASGEYGEAVEISWNTINNWAKDLGWAERASREVASIAPDLRHQAFSELLFSGLEGAKYIRRVVSGLEDEPNLDDIPKREGEDPTAHFDRVLAKSAAFDRARKTKLTASIAAVDRIGFSPIGKGLQEVSSPYGASESTQLPDLAGLSPEDLRRLEDQHRGKRTTDARTDGRAQRR